MKANDFHLLVGENPKKRAVVSTMYHRMFSNAGRYYSIKNVACMPGSSGWDVSFLKKYGVETIHVIDRDVAAIDALREKFGEGNGVVYHRCTTTKFVHSYDGPPLDLIYFDYFSGFNLSVEFDIKTIFNRDILRCGSRESGKLMVNFYSGRRPFEQRTRHRELIDNGCAAFGLDRPVLNSEQELVTAYNMFLGLMRVSSLMPNVQGRVSRVHVGTTSPSWYKYKTKSGHFMYINYCSFMSKNSKSSPKVIGMAVDRWLVTGKVRSVVKSGAKQLTNAVNLEDFAMDGIRKFYAKFYRTPTFFEIMGNVGHSKLVWNDLVRKVGLCPLKNATIEDVELEIKRIVAREGYVDFELLKRARVGRKSGYSHLAGFVRDSVGSSAIGRKSHNYLETLVIMWQFLKGTVDNFGKVWLKKCGYTPSDCATRVHDYCTRIHAIRVANKLPVIDIDLDFNNPDDSFGFRIEQRRNVYKKLISFVSSGRYFTIVDLSLELYGHKRGSGAIKQFLSKALANGDISKSLYDSFCGV